MHNDLEESAPSAKIAAKKSWLGRKIGRLNILLKKYNLGATRGEQLSTVPLHKRTFYLLIALSNKIKGMLAKNTITLFTQLDDFLVRSRQKGQKRPEAKPESQAQNPTAESRRTILGPLLAENTEARVGISWPNGLPKQELALYTNPRLIVVEGGETNRFGHALIGFGDPTGEPRYLQISSANWYPEHMNEQQFIEYCQRWGCHISQEINLHSQGLNRPQTSAEKGEKKFLPRVDPNQQAIQTAVDQLSRQKWLWQGPYHNCLTFVYELAQSAGLDIEQLQQHRTRDNVFPNRAFQGYLTAIIESVNSAELGLIEAKKEQILTQLEHQLQGAVQSSCHNPQATKEWLRTIRRNIIRHLDRLNLPPQTISKLKKNLTENLNHQTNKLMARADFDFLVDHLKSDMDIPKHAVRNMPVDLRYIGPQSRAGFNDDDGL